jgi:hypothetical protein
MKISFTTEPAMFGFLTPGPLELLIILVILAIAVAVGMFVLVKSLSSKGGGENLVPCPDCARQVSRSAVSCPQCGRPLQ